MRTLAVGGFLMLSARGGRAEALWCLLPACAVVAAHLFLIGSVRYRMPAWPFLEVLAGGGIGAMVRAALAGRSLGGSGEAAPTAAEG